MFRYKTKGTCSRIINIEVEDDIVTAVEFIGGCDGNTQGVARLAKGHTVDQLIGMLEGIDCGGRGTSCPDQLAKALKAYKESL